jgi:hypothetical protein
MRQSKWNRRAKLISPCKNKTKAHAGMKKSFLIVSLCCFSMAAVAQTLNRRMAVDSLWESMKVITEPGKAYVLVHSQIPNLRFESNRNIEKVVPISSGDWGLWLPAGTHILKIAAEGFQRLEIPPRNFATRRSYEMNIKAVGFSSLARADENLFDVVFQCNESGVYSSYGDYAPTLSKEKTLSYKVPRGEYVFRFQKQGFADEVLTLAVNGSKEITITMKAGTMSSAKRIKLPGIVRITSEPSGAEVLINGQKVGVTPYDNELVGGNHQLELRKPLYHPDISTFTLNEGETLQIPRTLKVRFGFLTVTTAPPRASVYVDGKSLGIAPVQRKEMESSRHTLRIELPLFHQVNREFETKDGEETRITEILRPAFGSLEVYSSPESGAEVFLDGQRVGSTSYSNQQLASGKYLLRVSKPLFSDAEEQIVIEDGQLLKKTVVMNKNFAELQVTAKGAIIIVNGKQVDSAHYSGKLAPGKYALRADRGAAYVPAEQDVYLSPGDKKEVTLEPQPRLGSVSVFVEPREASDAEVFIGDESKGNAPKVLSLLIGDYAVRLKKSNFLDASENVSIKEGEQKRLTLTMLTYEGSVLQAKRDKWGQAKWISAVGTVVASVAAIYFNQNSQTSYRNYQDATLSDAAVKFRDETKKNDVYFKLSVSIGGVALASSLFSWIMQSSQ